MTQPSNVLIDMGQIETANDGRCYANDISQAVIETVIIQEIESPEVRDANGQVSLNALPLFNKGVSNSAGPE